MLWLNLILGLDFIFFVSNSLSHKTIPTAKVNTFKTKDNMEPQHVHVYLFEVCACVSKFNPLTPRPTWD